MSKKNKKKLRKILRQQAQQVAMHTSAPETPVQTVATENIEQASVSAPATNTPIQKPATGDAKEVKHEIRKILLTMLILFAIIVGIYFVNLKTDMILKIGQWATHFLNINV